VELHCSYDPESKSGGATAGRKVKGTSHWVSASHALEAEVRIYNHLFMTENPDDEEEGTDYKAKLNPDSLQLLTGCKVEPELAKAVQGDRFQFLRQGYFSVDLDSTPEKLVFNRIVSLRDSWAKVAGQK